MPQPPEDGLRAILFDMDGVLLDTESTHTKAKKAAFQRHGLDVPDEWFARFRGQTDMAMMRHVADELGGGKVTAETLAKHKHEAYKELREGLQPVAGAKEFVGWARSRFARLALATSGTPDDRAFALRRLGLEDAFDAVLDAASISEHKPHPEPYLEAARKVGAEASRCLVVEDSVQGVRSAKAAGCLVAAITTSFRRDELQAAGADVVVDRYDELRAWLERPQQHAAPHEPRRARADA
ncbi:MAG TPA: HAD family phosphatase [Candidatus Thermoplasmatota archaeon]|nr:HAD family phosphatase [Candidatus Thermoplasmatota archaeon]